MPITGIKWKSNREYDIHLLRGRTLPALLAAVDVQLTDGSSQDAAAYLAANADVTINFQPSFRNVLDLTASEAIELLKGVNPHGRPNSDVIVPWVNGQDITRRSSGRYIVDFADRSEEQAARYEAPFALVGSGSSRRGKATGSQPTADRGGFTSGPGRR